MSDYISREAAINAVCEYRPHSCDRSDCGLVCQEAQAVVNIPAADVRPVVKAEIIDMCYAEEDGEWKCSYCGWQYTLCICGKDVTSKIHYCPNCGADMREANDV